MISFFVKTFGCQANIADSELVVTFLQSLSCVHTFDIAEADLMIVNTCAIRDKAEQKLFSYLGALSVYKKNKPFFKISVIGCVASYKKQEIYDRFDHVSFVFGAREDRKILFSYFLKTLNILKRVKNNKNKTIFLGGQNRNTEDLLINDTQVDCLKSLYEKQYKSNEFKKAYINIMSGCNKYCSYCIVPFVRGREISYSMEMLLDQVKLALSNGVKEVHLTGQNVNSYCCPETKRNFSALLRRISEINKNFWVRWMSPHPQDMTEELFDVIADRQDKIPPYVHFPVQSGSDKVLKLMRRNYSIRQYLEQINYLKKRINDVVLSTDFIVGFPCETRDDFRKTLNLIKNIQYDFSYSFIYSPRRYTRAWSMNDDCSVIEKVERLSVLQELQKQIAFKRNNRYVGKKVITLVEKRLANGKLLSRTKGNLRVFFDGDNSLIGKFVNLYVKASSPANLFAVKEEHKLNYDEAA
jgi:tRNA-2-methylthio-N6-dimethylallyladenosine synthase